MYVCVWVCVGVCGWVCLILKIDTPQHTLLPPTPLQISVNYQQRQVPAWHSFPPSFSMQPLGDVRVSTTGGVGEMQTGSIHYQLASRDVVSCFTCSYISYAPSCAVQPPIIDHLQTKLKQAYV